MCLLILTFLDLVRVYAIKYDLVKVFGKRLLKFPQPVQPTFLEQGF